MFFQSINVVAIDIPLNNVKTIDISSYFNQLLSAKRNKIIEERLISKFHISNPGSSTYSLGLLSIASSVKSHGYPVDYLLMNQGIIPLFESADYWLQKQVALFSCKTTTLPIALHLAKKIKQLNEGIVTVFGGPHCNALPHEVIKYDVVDFVSTGEGEEVITQLLDSLSQHKTLTHTLTHINGLYFKDDCGRLAVNPAKQLIENINTLPAIDYSLLPGSLPDYHVYVETSRGCEFYCSFCANPLFWERRIRCFDALKVYNELWKISQELPPNSLVHLVDPSYANSDSIFALCKLLDEKPLPLFYSCDLNALQVSKEKIMLMYQAGIRMFCIGVESFDEEVLAINHKPQTPDMVYNACKLIKENTEAFLKTYWITGLPGENEDSARKSRDAAVQLLSNGLIDMVCEHMFVPYPGCDVFHNPEQYKYMILHHDWEKYDARSFPLPGESRTFSMERVFLAYLDFLRAQCEFYKLSDRNALHELSKDYDFLGYKGGLI